MEIFGSGSWEMIFDSLVHDCAVVILASASAMMAFAILSRTLPALNGRVAGVHAARLRGR